MQNFSKSNTDQLRSFSSSDEAMAISDCLKNSLSTKLAAVTAGGLGSMQGQ